MRRRRGAAPNPRYRALTKKRSRWSLCGGSFQKPFERGKPARPAGSRTYCPPKKSHAKNAKSAKKWKAVMKRPTGAELRIRRNGEQNARSVHTKTTKPKTPPGWTPPSESFLTALPSRKCGSLQKTLSQPKPHRPAGSRLFQPLYIF